MHFTKLSFDEYMTKVASLIGISLSNPSISGATGRFGYDENRLKEGERYYRLVKSLDEEQSSAIDQKVQAHEKRKQLHAAVRKKYMKTLQIARISFDKDLLIRKALQLDGPRESKLDAWINQVEHFGNRLLGEEKWSAALKNYGISKKDIAGLMSDLENLRSVALECEKLKNDAKQQTSFKKGKMKELQDWVSDYLKIAKIALEDHPQLYKMLKEL
jgi:hypothetical protein